jgi:hypothetical protein
MMMAAKLPKNLSDVMKDKDLTEKLEAFCKKEHTPENFNFYTMKSWKSENVYRLYFAKGAKSELNLAFKTVAAAHLLAEKKLWDDKGWDAIMKAAKDEVTSVIERDTFKRFLKTLG